MLLSSGTFFQIVFVIKHINQRVFRTAAHSISTLSRFVSVEENDNAWLAKLDRKDWLAPNEILKIFKNLRDPGVITDALKKTSTRMDYKPSEALYSLLIFRLANARMFGAIDDLLQSAKHEKCELSDEFFCNVLKIYGNVANHPERAIETLFSMPEFDCWPTVKTFNYVLNMLVNSKQFETVHEVFQSAPRLGVALDTCCFNILIKGLCQHDKLEAAFSLLPEISKHGCRPNVTTYSTLMHALSKNNRVDEAFELYERMEIEGCYPDTITFNILIAGLCRQRRMSEGMEYLKKMKLKGCYPNSGTYNALLSGLLDTKMFVEAKDFIGMMISESKYPSFLSYRLVIDGLCDLCLLDDVELVMKQMVSQGFCPRMGTWKKVLNCVPHEMDWSYLSTYVDD